MSYTKATFYSSLSVSVASFIGAFIMFSGGGDYNLVVIMSLIVATCAGCISFIGCLLIAIPIYQFFKVHNIDNTIAFVLLGGLMPIVIVLLWVVMHSDEVQTNDFVLALVMGVSGLLAMSVFWFCMRQPQSQIKKNEENGLNYNIKSKN